MGKAAEFGTAAFVDARFAGHEPSLVYDGRHDVELAGEVGNPEAVDYVVGEEVNVYPGVDGDVKLVGGLYFVTGIAELPPPLVCPSGDVHPGHGYFVTDGCGRNDKSGLFDGDLVGGVNDFIDDVEGDVVVAGRGGVENDEQGRDCDADEDDSGSNGPGDFELGVAVGLLRDGLARASAVAEGAVYESTFDYYEDEGGEGEDNPEELQLTLGDFAFDFKGGLVATTGEEEKESEKKGG